MRVDNPLHDVKWFSDSGLAVAGSAGIYVFDFLAEPGST